MKHKALAGFFICALLAAGCHSARTAKSTTPTAFVPAAATADTVTDSSVPLAAQTTLSAAPTAMPQAAQSSTSGNAASAAPAVSVPSENIDSILIPASTKKEGAEPEDNTPQAPGAEQFVAAARAKQTLQTPSPDNAAFDDEELIPLEGRRLSPFAYEPVTQQDAPVPWSGEELKYGVYYSFIKAGTAYIKTRGLTTVNGRKAYLIQTTAFSASVIDAFFKVRDVNYSWMDAENFYSLGYSQSVREGNYRRDEWLTFDYDNNRFYGEMQKKEAPRALAGPVSQKVLDMLSSLYFVRAQKLEEGQDIIFDIINREKQYPLVVKVLGKETVKTPAGKFDCIIVEPQFRGEGIFVSKGKSLKVWLTDDEYKMPVKMKTEVFIGSVSAELLEYKRN